MEVTEKNFCNENSVDLENEDRLFKKTTKTWTKFLIEMNRDAH